MLGLSAFFSSSETSLFSLDRTQLAQMKRDMNPKAGLIERLLSEPRRLIVTILIGNEMVNVAASAISAAVVIGLLGADLKWVNIFVMVPLLLLFGEITPKTLAIRKNVAFASLQCTWLDRFARAIGPLRWLIRRISDFFITLIVGEERTAANIATEDMVRTLAAEAAGEGTLDPREAQYIHQIFDFGEKTARDIATPRSQIVMLPVNTPLLEAAREFGRTHHTKVPVHEVGDSDTILGVLFTRDLLGQDLRSGDDSVGLRGLLRKALFVPESRKASDLFLLFRRRKLSLALTVDEYGGVTGLVTMEDLLECIFGDIESRSEQLKRETAGFERLDANRYRIDASMTIKQFNSLVGDYLDDDGAETVGGVLLGQFGEIPQEGRVARIGDLRFTVQSIVGHRMGALLIEVAPRDAPAASEEEEDHQAETSGTEASDDADRRDGDEESR
ncbi:MAG: hemolysin family protein [Alphaproteobacteria bacterium]|nr:hemolysin family protein [Alphaproteobacteria bacterium]